MIDAIELKFGRSNGAEPLTIPRAPITVFVGPNNSGKSKTLAEINAFYQNGQVNAGDAIIKKITFRSLTAEAAKQALEKVILPPPASEQFPQGEVLVGKKNLRQKGQRNQILSFLQNPSQNLQNFCRYHLNYNTLMLGGENRISLTQQRPAGDLQQPPQNSLQLLFSDDALRESVRKVAYDAFKRYLVVDPTNIGQLRLRFSARPPADDNEERGWNQRAVDFHSNATLIDSCSDGMKAFTGMMIEIIAGDPSVVLIDEPEAFLHPALAFKLGKEISAALANTEKTIFASTHSAQFLMGCIQSGTPINIVRLTYRDGVATARLLQSTQISTLMRDPLLRSAGVMSAIFYESVVVTESDADRAFYQEINERLLRFDPTKGIPNCLFLNAQNKQTVRRIVAPLRQLGIPAASIVDIDIIKDGGQNWIDYLSSIGVPETLQHSLGVLRGDINRLFKDSEKCMKNDGGISILTDEGRRSAQSLLSQLAEYGGFVVPGGELESWLKNIKVMGHGPSWLAEIFEKMGDDPETENYTKPTAGDVWEFTATVQKWLMNSGRMGIPA